MSIISNHKPQLGSRGHFSVTTTTTTTYSSGPASPGCSPNPFANANGYNSSNSAAGHGIQLSSRAQMLMAMMSIMNAMMSGDCGSLMNMLNGFNGMQMPGRGGPVPNQLGQIPAGYPSFGQRGGGTQSAGPRRTGGPQAAAFGGADAPRMAKGEVKELKAGQTARGANGTVVKWGQDGKVGIDYLDKNGQKRHIDVKNGMMSIDGGKPIKLENVGQLLKLPNGDVVGIGNNPNGPEGKKMCRVVMSDSVDNIKTEPASATNIYEIEQLQQKQTCREGGGFSFNLNAGSYSTPFGSGSFMNANFSLHPGILVNRTLLGDPTLHFAGVK